MTPFLPQTETKVPLIHAPGSGQHVGVIGDQSTFKVLPSETGEAYAVLEQMVPPGGGPPLHVHRHETEIFYILDGDFEVFVGDRWIPAPAGTCATCPRDIPHTFRNIGTKTGRLLLTILPGRFGNYFIEVDGIPDRNHDTIRALCAKFGVEILAW
jgi:quercetin dioxygenase-like cupin family protein